MSGEAGNLKGVNFLPFSFAWGEEACQPWLKERALELYGNYPRLAENWVTKNMELRIFGKHEVEVNSAQRQQGLIHLYKTFCWERECHRCPLLLTSSHGEATRASYLFDAKAMEEVK